MWRWARGRRRDASRASARTGGCKPQLGEGPDCLLHQVCGLHNVKVKAMGGGGECAASGNA